MERRRSVHPADARQDIADAEVLQRVGLRPGPAYDRSRVSLGSEEEGGRLRGG